MTELSVSVENGADGAVIVRLSGEADVTTAPALAEALAEALGAPATGSAAVLVVEASRLTFIDSAALHVLVRAHRRLGSEGRCLVLVRPAPAVMRVLQLSGLDGVITVCASLSDAAEHQRRRRPPGEPT